MTVSEDCKLVADWMREPDHAEKFTFNSLNDWLDRRPIAEFARLTAALSDQAGGWQDFSTVPKDQEVEVRAIWKLRGDGFVFTHWRPAPPPSSTAGEGK